MDPGHFILFSNTVTLNTMKKSDKYMFSFVFWLIVILVISRFGFEGWFLGSDYFSS